MVLCLFFNTPSLQCWDKILEYSHNRLKYVLDDYKEIFEALPFPDKKR